MKIVVLGGGISTEREVALVTSTSVCKALRSLGHKAIFVDMFMGLENYDGALEDAFDVPTASAAASRSKEKRQTSKRSRHRASSRARAASAGTCLRYARLPDCVFLGLHGADGEDGKIQAALDLLRRSLYRLRPPQQRDGNG